MTLTILIWLPLAIALVAALVPARFARLIGVINALVTMLIAIDFIVSSNPPGARLSSRTMPVTSSDVSCPM